MNRNQEESDIGVTNCKRTRRASDKTKTIHLAIDIKHPSLYFAFKQIRVFIFQFHLSISSHCFLMKKSFYPNSSPTSQATHPCLDFHPQWRPRSYPRAHAARVHRPPETYLKVKPYFKVELRLGLRPSSREDIETLIKDCKHKEQSFTFYPDDEVAAVLSYKNWEEACDAAVWFWETLLLEKHDYTPELDSNASVTDSLDGRLRVLFRSHVMKVMEGKEVKRWVEESERLSKEIERVSRLRRNRWHFSSTNRNVDPRRGLVDEKDQVERRLKEFDSAMDCILKHLAEGADMEGADVEVEDRRSVNVLKFDGRCDWKRIHCLIRRECRRLEDGLPIYAYRKDILREIHDQKMVVLIGETGSGKSTQLVQFLADSGIGADESIVCTQSRKIAAKSVAQRVQEESSGCYEGQSVKCSTFSSLNELDSKIIFTTDHCLLQHYMRNDNLSGISCIIVDEAHERSLNTDLLMTLLKNLLHRRDDMRLIIMSATADANQLSDYFDGCSIFRVLGRSFPVDIKYAPPHHAGYSGSSVVALDVMDVVRKATEVHRTEKNGTILAFLTSQSEVEYACEKFKIIPSAVALPLHGKLSSDEQSRVFQNYPGKRKVIFSTNLAETSLTIPGVKYVIDSGLVKDCRYDPGSGMNVLKVCWISQSSADQRAGRAGRTEPGVCYRLYSETDYQSMDLNQEPEIRRVHLGVAVLRILALRVKNIQDFDFVDAPSSNSIDIAVRNLIQLGAIEMKNDGLDLTAEGWFLAKLGIEPRLGKLILGCYKHRLGREGLVLAAVMANACRIFCRVGSEFEKQRSDCLKVQFCHCDGDLFTLLAVYKEWDALPWGERKGWCFKNSINAKSMRRCQDTILEYESCLERELKIVIPSYWHWDPYTPSSYDKNLKRVILSSLAENVAMYSGCNQLGYEVAQTGQHVQLHPSCSLLVFAQKPNWVVFGEILSISNQYLVCVSTFDFQSLYDLCPAPLFDVSKMVERKLQMKTLCGLGCIVLKKFCGKANCNLLALVSRIRKACSEDRIYIEVNVDQNAVYLFASSNNMDTALALVNGALEFERKLLRAECIDKFLYHGSGPSPIALFGSGAEIKHLELEKRSLSIEVCHANINAIDDKELLMFLEKNTSGSICAVHKSAGNMKDEDKEKWGRITFTSPEFVKRATELDGHEFCGSSLKIFPSQLGGDKTFSYTDVKAKICWPRRISRGFAIVKCDIKDVNHILRDFYNLAIGGRYVRCEVGKKSMDSVVINGLGKDLSEAEILDVLRTATNRRILDFFLVRGDAVGNPPCSVLEEALLKAIYPSLPKRNPHISSCRVQVFVPGPKDAFMTALISFDGRLHLEAAKALEHIEGKALPGCLPWQKIKCQRSFQSSLIFPAPVFRVIREQLDGVLASFKNLRGLEIEEDRTFNGSHRVKITANATRTVADVRRPLEELLRGKIIEHDSLTPAVLQLMMSKDGFNLKNSLEQETGTYILFDRHNLNLRVFGSPNKVALAHDKVIQSLLSLHEEKQLEIHLRGRDLPPDLMKQVIKNFGPDLHGLKERVPGVDLKLNIRRHVISLNGRKELKTRVEEIIFEIARSCHHLVGTFDNDGPNCPICLCEVEDPFQLEGCGHLFCRLCLVEQCESAIKNQGTFPICCTHKDCGDPILLTDLRSLLFSDKLEELFRASLGAVVATSGGTYRFCPSPDCPSIYRVADPGTAGEPFVCGACYSETCTRCHLEYHPYLSCERYKEFKEDPDSSLMEWRRGKDEVKSCLACGHVIEKVDGCNHVECKCGKHVCWVCLEFFGGSDECYSHLRNVHTTII
ncbi:ATP-dependent RNA helicase DEAH12, chloroplastic isoform X1 [Vigna radiata var. radiata]|uniref:RNA helicase n=2 Tax=Vigna radiata var. radiata TaxID=3916 RepID=A0A1S3TJ69_VIGRR|nr:ATP-dependent RNA helicase DEAH12, chloroplastic isoform X1 [Vigna radiata var. radiata]